MASTNPTLTTANFGVIGLGVMGENLALNLEDHGQSIAVWNMETEWVDRFLGRNSGRQIIGTHSVQELCRSLERPRRILLMITAGEPVDMVVQKILPYWYDTAIDHQNGGYLAIRISKTPCAASSTAATAW